MRRLLLAVVLASTNVASAQIAPGEDHSPADDTSPTNPSPVTTPPDTTSPTDAPPATEPTPAVDPATTNPPVPDAKQPATPDPEDLIPQNPTTPVDALPSPVALQNDDPLTTAMWRADPPLALHWSLLAWPERIVELAFLPIGLVVASVERNRLDKRFKDWVKFYDGRIKLAPRFKFSFGDGLGGGLWIKRVGLFDDRAEFRVGGLYRRDGDYQVETRYEHLYLFPGGRHLRMHAYVEDDKNQRYFGLGGQSLQENRRVLRSSDQGVYAETDLQGIDAYTYSGSVSLGMRRQTLSPGTSKTVMAIDEGDVISTPPGFGDTALFADLKLVGRRDTRDTIGRPRRGLLLEGAALGRKDVSGHDLSAVTLSALARWHLPIIAEGRSLVLQVAGAAAMRIFPNDEIPLDSLAVIGRTNVRGYDRERFRDKYATVASAEYRFPIYEYLASRAGLDAFLFGDLGPIWGEDKFNLSPLRWSTGGGFRGAHETTSLFEVTIAYSPEGVQFNLGVEKAL